MEAREIVWEEAHAAAWQRSEWRVANRLFQAYGELSRGRKDRRPWELQLSRTLFFSGDRDLSLHYAERALATSNLTSDEQAVARVGTFLVALERGNQAHASDELEELDKVAPQLAAGYRGNWWRAAGDFGRARDCHAQALRDFAPDSRWHHIFAMDLEITERIAFPRSLGRYPRSEFNTVARLRDHYALLQRLSPGSATSKPVAREHARIARDDGYACLDQLRDALLMPKADDRNKALLRLNEAHHRSHEHFRLSWRFCAKHWTLPQVDVDQLSPTSDDSEIQISADGSEIKIGRRIISLCSKPTLQRAIQALRNPCSEAELVAQMWPEQRVLPRAAKNRVHVALHTLRKLGLRDHLVFQNGRYRLCWRSIDRM